MSGNRLRLATLLCSFVVGSILFTGACIFLLEWTANRTTVNRVMGLFSANRLEQLQRELTQSIDGIESQAEYTERGILSGSLSLIDKEELDAYAYGLTAATSMLDQVVFVSPDGAALFVARTGDDGVLVPRYVSAENSSIVARIEGLINKQSDPFWASPYAVQGMQTNYIYYVHPVLDKEGDRLVTMLFAISIKRISEILRSISKNDLAAFLIDDQQRVLVHPDLAEVNSEGTSSQHAIKSEVITEEILEKLKNAVPATRLENAMGPNFKAFEINIEDKDYILTVGPLQKRQGSLTYRVAWYFPADLLRNSPVAQGRTGVVALALIAVFAFLAGAVALYLVRPVRSAALGVAKVHQMDLKDISEIPRSRVRELDDFANSFNRMLFGLRMFSRYVPTQLVSKLIQSGKKSHEGEERVLSVLFTDIAGFAALSEQMETQEIAHLINQHLTLIGNAISKHDGTIDKYIGDSVMAFWGAPEPIDNPAIPAVMAATEISRVIKGENTARVMRGEIPIRIRIGIHMGPLVVGDFGAPSRVNYTVIGDTVNIASRLESLGTEVDPYADVITLISQEMVDHLNDMFHVEPVGEFQLKGRAAPTTVYRLR
ncbi:adenylate/guanylate cyclase domain-containing protein [Rhodobacteraceae bacterium RKSG542]|uniref:adenylate/guanylate cyclase domain-containing protein n=1 Tax=Pseudovibrio flavus TaxID=2529854 RepID=UPI0012BB8886|nr:adenylate/guanylate cyclase domain-containing protein [Pseudovibrio flavus]MTI18912.1 adenylate/guanylate cyclase domain-containing protein [Pseudovibrio flavus]